MESDLYESANNISVEIDFDELPKILGSSSQSVVFSNKHKNIDENEEKIEVVGQSENHAIYEIEINQREEMIKKLQNENANIVKERDEILEEYEDELKATQMKNHEFQKENVEMKQEIRILYHRIEEMQAKNEKSLKVVQRNKELEEILQQNEKIIEELQNTNRLLSQGLPETQEKIGNITDNSCRVGVEELILEKNKLLKRIVEMDSRFLESIKEIDDLKSELIDMKLKYAESETQKNEFFQQVMCKRKTSKKFNWEFFKFWKKTN